MKPKCILIVDDDQALRETLEQYFDQCHRCMTCPAGDAEEALAHLRRRPFDVMLTDINHPGMNGLELTQLVHRRHGPPVIILTGWFSSESRRAAIASGARVCLRKPFKLERLAEIVELVVSKGVHYTGEG
ncbi:MAG: response regulator [Desulfobacterales bacterium]|nr:response regulator [Desulfobacterales bacterium]